MNFNRHSRLEGLHALLSASKYSWINYTEQKLEAYVTSHKAAARGTRFHALAAELIRLGQKLPKTETTMNMYVNDALGFRMTPEQVLYYSDLCFGTADAIAFRVNPKTGLMLLRIHDLKMGLGPTKVTQLEVYAALFCLEYGYKPHDIEMEFRIYQNDEKRIYEGDPDAIAHIMDRIITFDRAITDMLEED